MMRDIAAVIDCLASGQMIILVDDEDRENEGDLLIAAQFVSDSAINFMACYGRGLICLTLTQQRCQQLNLSPMVNTNKSPYGTNFMVSIEAAAGVSTGICAADRAKTIQTAIASSTTADDLVSPGHIFPVQSESGGVLTRAGHTEAGCDLTALAGLFPAAVICEIMNEDGTMARLPDLEKFSAKHQLPIATIESLIHHRLQHEDLLSIGHQGTIETTLGRLHFVLYEDIINANVHLALHHGLLIKDTITVGVMVNPTPLDFLLLADYKNPNPSSWQKILTDLSKASSAVLLLIQAGNDSRYKIKQQLEDIKPSPDELGLNDYGRVVQMLRHLGVKKLRWQSPHLFGGMPSMGISVENESRQ